MDKTIRWALVIAASFICAAGAYEDWLKTGNEMETAPVKVVPASATPAPAANPAPAAPRAVIPVTAQPARHAYRPKTAEPTEPAPAPVIYYEPSAAPIPQPAPVRVPAAYRKPQAVPQRLPEPAPAPAVYQESAPENIEAESDDRLMWWESGSSFNSDEALETASDAWTVVSDFLDGHLDIGMRLTKNELENNTRSLEDSFLGNLTELDSDDGWTPRLFVNVMFIKYLGVEYTSDDLTARAYNFDGGNSDGVVELCGPIWSIVGRIPNPTRFTPYIGIGKASMDASFKMDTWWHLGYGSEEHWIDLGRPSTGYRNVKRNIIVSGEDVNVMFFGCAVRITDWLSADIYYRTMDISVDAHYNRTGAYDSDPTQILDGEFTLDHTTTGFGLKYVF